MGDPVMPLPIVDYCLQLQCHHRLSVQLKEVKLYNVHGIALSLNALQWAAAGYQTFCMWFAVQEKAGARPPV